MNPVILGRKRQEAALAFLDLYRAATTHQLARLFWGGNSRLASRHLRRLAADGMVRRFPHPVLRRGPYVYTRTTRQTAHSQQILHHLSLVEFHTAVVQTPGLKGVRVIPEMSWAENLVPDQTVITRETVWAVEHHLSGAFLHAPDYVRFFEEEEYLGRAWWREGLGVGVLILTTPLHLDRIRERLATCGLEARVALIENALANPMRYLA